MISWWTHIQNYCETVWSPVVRSLPPLNRAQVILPRHPTTGISHPPLCPPRERFVSSAPPHELRTRISFLSSSLPGHRTCN